MVFIMTIGLPGSGKSTYAQKLKDCVHISSDAIRKELFGSETDQSDHNTVFATMQKRTMNSLKKGENVYYDATNLNERRRVALLKQIRRIPGVICKAVVFATSIEICLQQNTNRQRNVPESAIMGMIKRYYPPSPYEGWDEIIVVPNVAKMTPEEKLEELKLIPHDNPHHRLSIGDHMQRAYDLYCSENADYDEDIATALKYHDIGKDHCKVWTNIKGNPTPEAHYFYHENVSAYVFLCLALSARMDQKQALYISWLIGKHMTLFYMSKDQLAEKYNAEEADKIEIIHKYDIRSEEE